MANKDTTLENLIKITENERSRQETILKNTKK